jgi:hypothetical protein
MHKLKDIYVVWSKENVSVQHKGFGKPKDGMYFDADDFDFRSYDQLFFEWFTALTLGAWEIPPHDPRMVSGALEEIDEYNLAADARFLITDRLSYQNRPKWMLPLEKSKKKKAT